MKKIGTALLAALLSALLITSLSSCDDLFESGEIEPFVGEYLSSTGYERVKHYYWGNTTIKSEREFLPSGCTFLIYSNKKVLFRYPNADDIIESRARVHTDYITFSGLNLDSSYRFALNKDHSLTYSYCEDKHGLDYDFVTRHCSLNYRGPIEEGKTSSAGNDAFDLG